MGLKFTRFRRKPRQKFSFSSSPDVSSRVEKLIVLCSLLNFPSNRIFCVESIGSKSRAYARIWGLPRIWQEALGVPPAYVLEVTHRFQKLNGSEQERVLLHELAHIPKNFSGALVGHNGLEKRVEEMEKRMEKR